MQSDHSLRTTDEERVAERMGSTGTAPSTRSFENDRLDPDDLAGVLEKIPAEPNLGRWVYTPDERVRIVRSLLVADGSPWIGRFSFLLSMSVLIASLGLANDQPAAVIAAMVVAPMMTPVLGIATSLMLGLVRQAMRLTLIVVVSSILAVAFGWAISASLVVQEVTGEELSRTTPRLRDMVIALAAGAAGMYSVVRKDLSGVVPGVAIAVALVPPLATIGILLDLNEWSLARGATLLYATNVLAIIVAAVVVLLVTDFMPSPPARNPRVIAVGLAIAASCVAVTVPVWQTSQQIDREVRFAHQAERAIDEWSTAHPANRILSQDITPGTATLVISGATAPTQLEVLRSDIANDDFPVPTVAFEWVPSSPIVIDG